jgi:hypothetical protein
MTEDPLFTLRPLRLCVRKGLIWNELAMKTERMATHSATGAMADLFDKQKNRLGEYLKAFRLVDCQVGAVFAGNTRGTQRRKGRQENRNGLKI